MLPEPVAPDTQRQEQGEILPKRLESGVAGDDSQVTRLASVPDDVEVLANDAIGITEDSAPP